MDALTSHVHKGELTLHGGGDLSHPKAVKMQYLQELNPDEKYDVMFWKCADDTIRVDIVHEAQVLFKMLIEL